MGRAQIIWSNNVSFGIVQEVFWALLTAFPPDCAWKKLDHPTCLNRIVVTLVTSRSPTLATKLELRGGLTMKRSIAMALLVCTSVVFSHRSSLAQQDQSEVERKVLSKVAPTYPNLARKTNIHGAVKLGVVIGPDGRVESTKVIGGNPVLIQAALDAVRKWKYEAGPQRTSEVVELKFDIRWTLAPQSAAGSLTWFLLVSGNPRPSRVSPHSAGITLKTSVSQEWSLINVCRQELQ
jgi:TonB family protein